MKNYRYVIWDFNGTLFDDVSASVAAVNTLISRRNLRPPLTVEEYRRVFRFPITEYYADLGFDFEKESFSDLAVEWVNAYLAAAVPKRSPGVKAVLDFFRQRGVCQVIVSASEKQMIECQLSMLELEGYFTEICGRDDIYATDKTALAVSFAKRAPPGAKLFIGDTTHDFESARSIGADCILLANGHQCRQRLEPCGCPVADSADQIIHILQEQ